jgi:DNA-directed RNA polymerase specialized sigma24 family protein
MRRTVEETADIEALVERAGENDREALAGLYGRFRDRVARFATGRLGDAEKAEDVTSETFEAMLRNLRSYRPGTDFEAWLFTIAHRRVSDHFRRLGRPTRSRCWRRSTRPCRPRPPPNGSGQPGPPPPWPRADPPGALPSWSERPPACWMGAMVAEVERLAVRKTYKLYIGGKFPRTESGRSYLVSDARGRPLANACRASRKDVRDAVRAARGAFAGWSGLTAYNRGQILYRVAEMLEGRRKQFVDEVAAAEGSSRRAAADAVERAIDRWVWYAGWSDKIAQVLGSANPVAGPYFNFSVPEPTGVIGLVAPADSSLLGLVSRLAPAIVSGNTTVVLASQDRPLPAVTLTEVLATSDLPGGVVNLLTGFTAELVKPLAAHMDVDGLDLAGLDLALLRDAELAAADSVKRVAPPLKLAAKDWLDDAKGQDPYWMARFLEIKTVWHPAGV